MVRGAGMKELTLETPQVIRIREVIEVEALRGKGIVGDCIRIVTQYYSREGNLLAENDPGA